ncbi:MAG: hypothetical protein FJY10_06390 [Bacteroidetes bacterium]|nr:hypothetical protein [Bacteroidota bacterium]
MVKNISNIRPIEIRDILQLVVLLIIILIFSCKQNKPCKELILDSRVYQILNEYVQKHPQYNTFILMAYPLQMIDDSVNESGFLLGPGYNELIRDYSQIYFDFEDNRVYYVSEISSILKINSNDWNNINVSDSIVISEKDSTLSIIKDAWPLFITHAIFFNFNQANSISINYRPDTIFAPKRCKTSIKFENIEQR